MELLTWWPVSLFFGLLVVLVVLQLKFPHLNPRNRKRPMHPSESREGEQRHAGRMTGLRAMADDIKAQEAVGETPSKETRDHVVEQTQGQSDHW